MTHNTKVQKNNPFPYDDNTSNKLVDVIGSALLEKKAKDIVLLDVTELTTLTDYFIICHGGSETQIKTLTSSVSKKTREELGEKEWRKEGTNSNRWVVVDYVNIVVHIFNEETRERYGLERMWNDAKLTRITDN